MSKIRRNAGAFAFVKIGEFSSTNYHVLEQLKTHFPDLEPDVIDLKDLHTNRLTTLPCLLAAVAKEYGLSAFVSGMRLHDHMLKTGYSFRRKRRAMLKRLKGKHYRFTFQTQSLFDASYPGIPHFIYTDHTHLENLKYPNPTAATPFSRSWAEMERQAFQNARTVFTMSENISRSLVEQYGCAPEKVRCVYAGGSVRATAPDHTDVARFSAKNILFVGVDWERKGGPDLLKAFRALKDLHPAATLTIVGCSPKIREPGVHVAGRVPPSEVARYYQSASIFCMPTLNEPFGLVFLEAFSFGLPIVATRLGAIPEIVSDGESGYLVTPRDTAGLTSCLNQLLSDPRQCAKFGSVGRIKVEQHYSWKKTGIALASHIRRLAWLAQPAESTFAEPAVPPAARLVAVK